MERFSDTGSTPVASTKMLESRDISGFYFFTHDFYTILFKI